jgi:hypothetical protein
MSAVAWSDSTEMSPTAAEVRARSQAQGLKPWAPGEVCAPARLRFYRATVSELFVIDGFDQRIRVEIG